MGQNREPSSVNGNHLFWDALPGGGTGGFLNNFHGGTDGGASPINGYQATNSGSASIRQNGGVWSRNRTDINYDALWTGDIQILNINVPGASAAVGVGGTGGQTGNSTRDMNSYIGEMIFYSNTLTPDEQLRVYSYLGLKYGLTLSAGTTNYVASDGTTNMWTIPTGGAAAYIHDIFGIGRDNGSGLEQRVSNSVASDDRLSVSTQAGLPNSNAAATTAIANNFSFVTLSNNNGDIAKRPYTSAPTFVGRVNSIMNRHWYVQKTNYTQDVWICFPTASLGTGTHFMIVSSDGNFNDGVGETLYPSTTSNSGGQTGRMFTNAELPNGSYIAFASYQVAPAGLAVGNTLWQRFDNAQINFGTSQLIATQNSGLDNLANLQYFDRHDGATPLTAVNFTTSNFNGQAVFNGTTNGLRSYTDPSTSAHNTSGIFDVNGSDAGTIYTVYKGGGSVFTAGSDVQGDRIAINSSGLVYRGVGYVKPSVVTTNRIIDAVAFNRVGFVDGSADRMKQFTNGAANGSSTTFPDAQNLNTRMLIGVRDNGAGAFVGHFNGEFNEFITFNYALSIAERERMDAYLAIKFGITIAKYVDRYGNVVWNSATQPGFTNDVFGLAREDGHVLDQRIARSENRDDILILSTNNDFTTSNHPNFGTGRTQVSADNAYYLVANDDAGITVQTTGVPAGYNGRISRTWRMTKNANFTQNVNMQFTTLRSKNSVTLKLIKSPTNDFVNDFVDLGALSATGTISNVALNSGDYFTVVVAQLAPGGVTNRLQVWHKADAVTGTTGGGILTAGWENQTAVNNIPTPPATAANDPFQLNTVAQGLNFNPIINFDGDDNLAYPTNFTNTWTAADVFSVHSSLEYPAGGTQHGFPYDYGGTARGMHYPWTDGNYYNGFASTTRQAFNFVTGAVVEAKGIAGPTINIPGFNPRNFKSMNVYSAASDWATSFNGVSLGVDGANLANFATPNGTTVGSNSTIFFKGNIGEIVLYDRKLTPLERRKVNTYLALKYGVSLDQTTAGGQKDYVATNNAIVWAAADNAGYDKNIFGIARDSVEALDQRVATSADSTIGVKVDVLSIALQNNFTAMNAAAARTVAHANPLQYFMVGGNSMGSNLIGTDLDLTKYAVRLAREWKVDKTANFTQAVTLKFDVMANATAYARYYLIKAGAASNGNFSTGTTELGQLAADGTVTTDQLMDGEYFTVAIFVNTPGGIAPNLSLWYRTDDGPGLVGADIDTWDDRSIGNNDATTPGGNPARLANGLNFNPVARFSRAETDYLKARDGFNDFTAGVSAYIVYKPTSTAASSSWERFFDFGVANSNSNVIFARSGVSDNIAATAFNGTTSAANITSGAVLIKDTASIFSFNLAGGTVGANVAGTVHKNHKQEGAGNTLVPNIINRTNNFIGRSNWFALGDQDINGDIAEVILYNKSVTVAERLRIESYLAIKYGISIDQTTATNYVAGDGTTTMWVAADNAGYTNDIFGLGRDTVSVLNQKVARSTSTKTDPLIIALDNNFTATNEDAARTTAHANPMQFFMVANNGLDLARNNLQTSQIPAAYQGRVKRTWKVDKTTNFTQSVWLSFGTTFAPTFGSGTTKFFVLRDSDGDFTNAALVGELNANGSLPAAVNFADGEYFTLAVQYLAPGAVTNKLNLWLKANTPLTFSANLVDITTWHDQSPNKANALNIKPGDAFTPNLFPANTLNFNPVIDYTAIAEVLGDTTARLITQANADIAIVTNNITTAGGILSMQAQGTTLGAAYDDPSIGSSALFSGVNSSNTTYPTAFTTNAVFSNSYFVGGFGVSLFRNGVANGAANFGQATHFPNQVGYVIGDDRNAAGAGNGDDPGFQGQIAEIIVYDKNNTAAERAKVNTYLAVKYGINIDQTAGGGTDYVATNAAVIWDKSAGAGNAYKFDIFGIARDSAEALDQRVSRSTNSDDIITLALQNNFTAANADAVRNVTHANPLQYFMIANNDAGITLNGAATELPTGAGFNARYNREWRVSKTANFTQEVFLNFTGLSNNGVSIRYFLVKDDDGDFTTGTTTIGQIPASGAISTTLLNDGDYFALMTKVFAPGGVVPGLTLWTKANHYNFAATTDVNNWPDYSVNSNHLNVASTAPGTPIRYVNNLANFNPAIDFSAADNRWLGTTSTANALGLNGDNTFAEFYAFAPFRFSSGVADDDIVAFGNTANYHRLENSTNALETSNIGIFGNAPITNTSQTLQRATAIMGVNYDGANYDGYVKGGRTQRIASAVGIVADGQFRVGSDFDGLDGEYNGTRSAEIAIYNRNLTATELQRVYSYLSVKYGTTLDQTTAQDYLASDGTTRMWTAADNTGYNADIFGLAKDNEQQLDQRVARASDLNSVDSITVALDNNFTAHNADTLAGGQRTTGFVADMQFLMIAANGVSILNETTNELPAGYGFKLEREWKVDKTANFTQPIFMHFQRFRTNQFVKYYLMRDSDGDFGTGATLVSEISATGTITTSVNFADGEYFTIVGNVKAPGGVSKGLQLWVRADNTVNPLAANNAVGAAWTDISGKNNNAIVRGDGPMTLLNNEHNFNPAINHANGDNNFLEWKRFQSQGMYWVGRNRELSATAADHIFSDLADPGLSYHGGVKSYHGNAAGNFGLYGAGIWRKNGAPATDATAWTNELQMVSTRTNGGVPVNSTGGQGCCSLRDMDAAISEIVGYNTLLNFTERKRVESYLAVKYGLTMGGGDSTYLASDGTTTTWDPTTAGAYKHNIFALALDTNTYLDQRIARSTGGTTDIVTVSTSPDFVAPNTATGARPQVTATDKQFLFIANNNDTTGLSQNELPAGYSMRMVREWKVTRTAGYNIPVSLRFDNYLNNGNPYIQYFMVKKNGDSDFSSGTTLVGALSATGTITTTLANNDYFTIFVKQKAPGGVFANLGLWLRADDGVTFTAGNVEGWTDRSRAGKNASTPGAEPGYGAAVMNFNPGLFFDVVASKYMQVANGFADFTGGISTYSAVNFANHAPAIFPRVYDFGNGGPDANVLLARTNASNNLVYQNYLAGGAVPNPGLTSTGGAVDNQTSILSTWQAAGAAGSTSTANIGLNNASIGTAAVNVPPVVNRTLNYIGRSNFVADTYLNGRISEVIFYDRENTAVERQRINSYLAIKYGTTLNQATPTNYLASDGTTVIWDATTANVTAGAQPWDYKFDIAGIYRDTNQVLYQKQSASASTGNTVNGTPGGAPILTIGLNTIAATNQANTGVLANDKSGMVWASNNTAATGAGLISTNTPGSCISERVERQWQMQVKNGASANATQVQFNLTGITSALPAGAGNYLLMIDGDGDGDFTTGAAQLRLIDATSYNSAAKIATFTGVNFDTDGNGTDVFALATRRTLQSPIVTPNNTTETATVNCQVGQLTYYRSPTNVTSFIMSFNRQGQTLAPTEVKVEHTVNGLVPATTVGQFTETSSYLQNLDVATGDFLRVSRRFHTVQAPAPSGAVRVRVYFNLADTTAMIADAVPGVKPLTERGWYKIAVNGAQATINAMTPTTFTGATPIIPVNSGTEQGINFVEFEVTSFSTFGYYAKSAPSCNPVLTPNAVAGGNIFVSEECALSGLTYLRVPAATEANIAFNKNGNTIDFNANPVNINNTGALNYPQGTSAGYYEITNGSASMAPGDNRTNRVSHLLTHVPVTQTFTAGSPVTIRMFYNPASVGPTSPMVTTPLANGLPVTAHGWFIRDNSTPQQVLDNTGTIVMTGARPIAGTLGVDVSSGLNYVEFVVNDIANATFGYYANSSVVVPIRLSSFDVVKSGKTSVVRWVTSNEVDNSRFIIERSTDGITYAPIGSVNGKGTSSVQNSYTFTDNKPSGGKNYYRLRAVSISGREDLSNVKLLVFADGNTVFVYPNPFIGSNLNAIVNVTKAQRATVQLIGSDGKSIKSYNKNLVEGNNVVNFTDLTTLSKGMYVMQVTFEDGSRQQVKVVKN